MECLVQMAKTIILRVYVFICTQKSEQATCRKTQIWPLFGFLKCVRIIGRSLICKMIVWQRFCEPTSLRIAYCPSVFHVPCSLFHVLLDISFHYVNPVQLMGMKSLFFNSTSVIFVHPFARQAVRWGPFIQCRFLCNYTMVAWDGHHFACWQKSFVFHSGGYHLFVWTLF